MAELETILAPVSVNGEDPTCFFGMVQMMSDSAPLLDRSIAYQRLIGSQMIQEDEPFAGAGPNQPPPPSLRPRPKAPCLRLVHFGMGDALQKTSGDGSAPHQMPRAARVNWFPNP